MGWIKALRDKRKQRELDLVNEQLASGVYDTSGFDPRTDAHGVVHSGSIISSSAESTGLARLERDLTTPHTHTDWQGD